MGKEIVFIVKGGDVQIEVNGAEGTECVDMTRPFEEALGLEVERDLKPEYHGDAAVYVTAGGG